MNYSDSNKNEQKMQDLWDMIKRPNMWIIGVHKRAEVQANGIENLLSEMIAEKFPNHGKDMGIQVQENFN